MAEYKVWINYILVRMKIRDILPKKIIRNVKIIENNEELEELNTEKYKIVLDSRMEKPVYLRKTVCKKLYNLAEDVKKDGLYIKLYDAYRSRKQQEESWKKRIEETRKEYPNVSEEELIRITSLKVANPKEDNVGGHQTGGAIDITFIDENGKELDMDCKYEEYNNKTRMKSKDISKEARKNRKYLNDKLKKNEFVNFPAEWWHFCYGDKMWAAYKNKKTCFYGFVEPKDIK